MKRSASILLLALIVAGVVGGGVLNRRLVDQRRAYGITQADPLVNAPPLVVFTTVAFGGFRGIVADMLWIRSARLQQEGKFFELVQLADWITKLEPRFTEVWAYHAWNLTYNISVLFTGHEDRWRWVRHGVSLLRDEGLRYNPGEASLLYELGWMFQHKIGGNADDAHMRYKRAWAAEMTDALETEALARDYKMNPATMQALDAQYGPLDWRLPHAHAVYWAAESRAVARRPFDGLQAHRMLYQSLVESFRSGRLFTGEAGDQFVLSPSLDLWPSVVRAFEEAIAHPQDQGSGTIALGYFLQEAVIYLHAYGRYDEARRSFERLKSVNPEIPAELTLDDFVGMAYANEEVLLNREMVFAIVESSLYRAHHARAAGDHAGAEQLENQAADTWNSFMAPRLENPAFRERTGLPPLDAIRQSAEARASQIH